MSDEEILRANKVPMRQLPHTGDWVEDVPSPVANPCAKECAERWDAGREYGHAMGMALSRERTINEIVELIVEQQATEKRLAEGIPVVDMAAMGAIQVLSELREQIEEIR